LPVAVDAGPPEVKAAAVACGVVVLVIKPGFVGRVLAPGNAVIAMAENCEAQSRPCGQTEDATFVIAAVARGWLRNRPRKKKTTAGEKVGRRERVYSVDLGRNSFLVLL